jgi:cyclopropane-fatty-acyl-phospholipid synthase
MLNLFIQVLLICVVLQFSAWLWQLKTKNADIVDITWSAGIVLCSIYYYLVASESLTKNFLMLIFPAFWYFRLTVHLIIRYKINHEDNRYAYLRKHWQHATQFKFFMFFMFQALLIWIFVLPAYWLSFVVFDWNLKILAAFLIGTISIVGVTLADKQLLNFKTNSNNSKKVCDIGLWKYSRHPNYFFEWTHWFVYPILLYNTPYFYWASIFPILMYLFLLKLTGIPFSEQQSLINRGDSYRDYQNRTNKFFPWKPKVD